MKVSIVIPTYNRIEYLERLLQSIERQTFKKFEVIIIDDNSPNKEVYDKLVARYKCVFEEFTFLRNKKNYGAPYSRNRGIKKSKYKYIALVDDDDEWLPTKLEKQIKIFRNGKNNLGIVYTWANAINNNGEVLHRYRKNIEGNPKEEILKSCFIPSPSILVKKTHILKAGLFDINLPSCQDWDMWTRMILMGSECRVVRSVETLYHKHNYDSIGVSKKAYKGFLIYYKKHFFSALKVNPIIAVYFLYKYITISLKKHVWFL